MARNAGEKIMAAKGKSKKPAQSDAPAAKPTKKTKKKLSVAVRLKLILFVMLLFGAGVVYLLHHTGIITVQDIAVRLGLSDKPATRVDLEVHFVDVGQGDCELIISQGNVMLIDSGDHDESNKVVNYLLIHGITHIDYVIATHPHADHIGEMSRILGTFDVGKFIMPRIPEKYVPTTKNYEDMLTVLYAKNIPTVEAEDMQFELGLCDVQIYSSDIEDSDNLNDYSVIVRLVHGKNSFLFTGDCEKTEEKSLLSRGCELSAKVLKVAHHGSATASSAEFLDAVGPDYAVISCGRNNDYGHPHESTVRRLSKYANKTFITEQDGDIVFISDGEGLSVECSGDIK